MSQQVAISSVLRRDGRGRFTSVDIIKRNDVIYFIAHPDDYVRSENTHDASGRLTPITVGVARKNEQDTIYQAIEDEIGKEPDSLWHFKTTFVEIKFYFPTSRFRRASSPTIRVTPTSCNLARLTSDRAEIVQKHLKMWGVDNASGDQSALAAMGG